MAIDWKDTRNGSQKRWHCGHCGSVSGTGRCYAGRVAEGIWQYIYICSYCNEPTYWDLKSRQIPGALPGAPVAALPEDVESLYQEARRCIAAGAPTAATMACRKILMNLAVSNGADKNKQFAHYVDWMAENGYVPPGGDVWVKQIKDTGNEANHELPHIETDRAEKILKFTEGLLRFVHEFRSEAEEPVEQPSDT